MEERGKKNTRRRPQERRRRNTAGRRCRSAGARRRRRRKRIVRIAVLCILLALVLLLGAGITAAVRAFLRSGAGDEGAENTAKDITIETPQGNGGVEDISPGDAQPEEDQTKETQKAENTATEEHHKTNGLAICMYHYVYDEADPPDDLNNNYIEVHALEEEIKYLVENDYYFPTWEEVRQYVEGDLFLPEKSVVLTFDDGAKSFLDLGIPVFEKYQVPATSFLITSKEGENKVREYQSDHVTFQSHSDNMHRAGGNIGHGGIFTAMSHDDAVTDLKKSIEICGHGDAFAYPYGDYTDDCRTAVQDAGFTCAVTTENRRAEPGDDPLLLPRVRMSLGQSLESFIALVE